MISTARSTATLVVTTSPSPHGVFTRTDQGASSNPRATSTRWPAAFTGGSSVTLMCRMDSAAYPASAPSSTIQNRAPPLALASLVTPREPGPPSPAPPLPGGPVPPGPTRQLAALRAEVLLIEGPVGDVRPHLLVKIDRQADDTVAITFTAELYDEAERVASTGNQFTVPAGSTNTWSGLHLVDHHSGDPDTADMDFTVTNSQGLLPGWQPPFPITPPDPAQPGALASVSRFRDQLDVFWIAPDGSVATTFWTVG
jgi:hypothetical protein